MKEEGACLIEEFMHGLFRTKMEELLRRKSLKRYHFIGNWDCKVYLFSPVYEFELIEGW